MQLQTPAGTLETRKRLAGGDILACGFAITVAAWIVAYTSRLPAVNAPGHVTVGLMLAAIFIGGILTARYSARGFWAAVIAGAISGLLNNLIVGSLLHDVTNRGLAGELATTLSATASAAVAATGPSPIPVPSMALWFGGSIVCNTILAGAGGLIGMFLPSPRRSDIRWTQVFAIVLAAATLPLLTIGGLVTAFHAGLAVPDWPRSYGYNMFLFPLSRMQSNQGNFYEHAHRLMGSLVGFTALALAIYTTVAERRTWVKVLAWAIGAAIALQAILGALRVLDKSVDLALAHGVFAQLVFAAMACLATVTGETFVHYAPRDRPSATTDRAFTLALVVALAVQLVFGAFVRHKNELLMTHITMAVLVVFLVLACGVRAWGVNGDVRPLRSAGLWLLALVVVQVTLGVLSLVYRSGPEGEPTMAGAFLTTAHQANGALLLATSAVLCVWTWRLLKPVPPDLTMAVTGWA